MDIFKKIYDFLTSPVFMAFLHFNLYFLFALWLSLVVWTYRDAKKRGSFAFFWALAVLVFNFYGWIIYLIFRPPEYLDEAKERELEIKEREARLKYEVYLCPGCRRQAEKDFVVCPYCFKKLKRACSNCNRLLQLDWSVCPYCQTTL